MKTKSSKNATKNEKGIQIAHMKRLEAKEKTAKDQMEANDRKAANDWTAGVNIKAKLKADVHGLKKRRADQKRREKKALEATEAEELAKIKTARAAKGRSRSMGSDPISPLARRGRSQSVDLSISPESWKSVPSLARSVSNENTKVKLVVLTMNGSETTMFMTKNSTVRDIKLKVEHLCGVPEVSQVLLSPDHNSGKPLTDSATLKGLGFRQGTVLFCSNNAGTIDQWAAFQHFRSPQKPKKHVEFSVNEKMAIKTSAHPRPTYVFTAGSVSGQRGSPVREWDVKVNALDSRNGHLVVGLFQGRALKLDEDPIPTPAAVATSKVSWGSSSGVGSIDTQSPIWCVATNGKYKTPEMTGFISLPSNAISMQQVRAGDVIRISLQPDLGQLEFYKLSRDKDHDPEEDSAPSRPEATDTHPSSRPSLTLAKFELWYSLPLGLEAEKSNDLHLFATLQSKGDSVAIISST